LELVSNSLGGARPSLNWMAASNVNLDAAIRARFSGSAVILEAIVSQDLWFGHCFFGLPGSHNNINVLNVSLLFTNLLNGISPKCEYKINGNQYTQGYYLADGIYSNYSTIVKTLSQPEGLDRKASDPFFWNSTFVDKQTKDCID
jgi:hypothetical protein